MDFKDINAIALKAATNKTKKRFIKLVQGKDGNQEEKEFLAVPFSYKGLYFALEKTDFRGSYHITEATTGLSFPTPNDRYISTLKETVYYLVDYIVNKVGFDKVKKTIDETPKLKANPNGTEVKRVIVKKNTGQSSIKAMKKQTFNYISPSGDQMEISGTPFNYKGIDLVVAKRNGLWFVFEVGTGLSLIGVREGANNGAKTKDAIINLATSKIESMGLDATKEAIAKNVKQKEVEYTTKANAEKERERKEKIKETHEISRAFAERQKQLEKYIPADEIQEEKNIDKANAILNRLENNGQITQKEADWLNETQFIAKGFKYTRYGLQKTAIKPEPKPKEEAKPVKPPKAKATMRTKKTSKVATEKTPLMKQFEIIKSKHPGSIVLFRLGDFFETFGEDAITISKVLGIILTRRSNGNGTFTELAGFPAHAIDINLLKLIRAGFKVAIAEDINEKTSYVNKYDESYITKLQQKNKKDQKEPKPIKIKQKPKPKAKVKPTKIKPVKTMKTATPKKTRKKANLKQLKALAKGQTIRKRAMEIMEKAGKRKVCKDVYNTTLAKAMRKASAELK